MELCCILEYLLVPIGLGILIAVVNFFTTKERNLNGKHVLITGGSSGIGLGVAHDVARRGASVTLVARNLANLEKALEEVRSTASKAGAGGKVQIFSADISGNHEQIVSLVKDAESSQGPIYMLVNCAGFARAMKFEDISPQLAKQLMDVNFMGSVLITQEVVRSMKQQQEGIIVFTSSLGGLLGIYGFTLYSAAKGALVKLAEALCQEVKPYNITVTVCYPPDTDTPGYEEENKTKPIETKLISESAGLFKADEVACKLVKDALRGSFCSTVGIEGFMLTALCAGMWPIANFAAELAAFLAQILLTWVFRIISLFTLWSFDRIVRQEHQKRLASKKSE